MTWKGLEYSNQEFWRFDFVLGVSCCSLHLQALLTVKQYTNANCKLLHCDIFHTFKYLVQKANKMYLQTGNTNVHSHFKNVHNTNR